MAPRVIADSDDDDDGSSYESPPSKSPAPGRCDLDPTRSHEPVDRSGSTDSAFFRSVLDEQSAAARNCARILRETHAKPASESYVAPTTMSTDQLQDPGELPDQFSKGGADDPWEVPSSPENGDSSAKARRKPGNRVEDTSSVQEEQSRRSSKRRKIESLPDHTCESDGIELVQLPPTQQPAHLIGNNLTRSQREAYQTFAATGATQISQDQGPAQRENATPIARSSSSATNVNTPRNDIKISRNMDTILERQQQPPEEADVRTPIERQWNSSPDEISAPQPISSITPAKKRKQEKRHNLPVPPEDEAMESEFDLDFDKVDPVIFEPQDDGSDYEETRVKAQKPKKSKGRPRKTTEATPANEDEVSKRNPDGRFEEADPATYEIKDDETDVVVGKHKKQRGRPKKTSDAASATDPANPPTSHAAEGRPVTKLKKKRGRPRKAEQQAAKDTTEEVADDTRVDAEDQAVAKESIDAPTADSVPDEADPELHEKAANTSVDLPKEEPPSMGKDRKSPVETDNKCEGPDQAKYPTLATKTSAAAVPPSGGKPIYRVGLSKRSRIAPLLKIRK